VTALIVLVPVAVLLVMVIQTRRIVDLEALAIDVKHMARLYQQAWGQMGEGYLAKNEIPRALVAFRCANSYGEIHDRASEITYRDTEAEAQEESE